jgi:hypothetical protein
MNENTPKTAQVKRFRPAMKGRPCFLEAGIEESADGNYVLYSDYKARVKQCEIYWLETHRWSEASKRDRTERDTLSARIAALEAQVQKLREAIRGTLDDSAKYPQLRMHEMQEERLSAALQPKDKDES